MLRGSFLSCKDSFPALQGEGRHQASKAVKGQHGQRREPGDLRDSPSAKQDIM